jgi:hypothetical protein
MLKHCATNRKRRLSALPNLGPYIYTTLKFLSLQGAPYIYDISRLRVNTVSVTSGKGAKFSSAANCQQSAREYGYVWDISVEIALVKLVAHHKGDTTTGEFTGTGWFPNGKARSTVPIEI